MPKFSKLKGIGEEISEVLSDSRVAALLGETRHRDISHFVNRRISETQKFALQEARD